MKKSPLELDYETADRIAVLSLKDHRTYVKKDLADYKKGRYMHPEDVVHSQKLIEAMDLIIKYYGE